MSGSATSRLATSHFLDVNFVTLGVADHAGGNFSTFQRPLAETKCFAVTHRQNAIKNQLRTGFDFAEIDFENLAFFNSVLTAAVSNDRVHGFKKSVKNLIERDANGLLQDGEV